MHRLVEIDIARGIAIFFMVIANYSPYFVDNPNIFLRLIYTFAAPLFICITGFLMYKNKVEKNYGWKYFLSRGILLVIVASLLEIIVYRYYPLVSFDVLYLIGFCTIIFTLLYNIWKTIGPSFLIIIFSFTILIQTLWGYNQQVIEYSLSSSVTISEFFKVFIRQSLLDGYFPIFPWVGIFVLGFYFYEQNFKAIILRFGNLWIVLFVILSYFLMNSGKYVRNGYGELFYPPDWIFILWALAFIFTSWYAIQQKINNLGFISWYLEKIGKSPLFFYILHLLLIDYLWKNISLTSFALSKKDIYLDFALSVGFTFLLMGIISTYFERLKKTKRLPFIIKFFIGS